MTRTELINKCVAASNPPDADQRERTRQYFSAFNDEDLVEQFEALIGKTDLDEQRAALEREKQKLRIFQTSGLANIEVNDRELDRQLPGGLLTLETFASLIKNEAVKTKFVWQTQPFVKAKAEREQRTQADKEAFAQAARELVASPNEANFSLVVGALGSGFSSFDVKTAAQSGKLQLLPASAEEMAQYHQDAIDAHNAMLRNLAAKGDIATLRLLAQREADENRRKIPQQQAEFNLEAIRERDSHRGYPPLPKSITKFQLQAATREYTTVLVQKYGKYQLLNRLMTEGE